jgi:hypothetical protein
MSATVIGANWSPTKRESAVLTSPPNEWSGGDSPPCARGRGHPRSNFSTPAKACPVAAEPLQVIRGSIELRL